ncbi:hypothetical protein [Bacillus sp. E(2018)]|uniref:hypothetical protein n=1 Tax=Bacillus sp. E(2018) TaxID=2502239 RepID=UPI0010FA05BC|nr:hypothetical protein [Bacillus sp. E(2018)]
MNVIFEFIDKYLNGPLNCFYVNDQVQIKSNNKSLFSHLLNQFRPFFRVSHSIKKMTDIEMHVYSFDELKIINLLTNFNMGQETKQFLGINNKYLHWGRLEEEQYIISYNKQFLSIIIQEKKNPNHIVMIGANSTVFHTVRKFLKEEILYKSLLKTRSLMINSTVIEDCHGNGHAILGDNVRLNALLIEEMMNNKWSVINMKKGIFRVELSNIKVYGTPEKYLYSQSQVTEDKTSFSLHPIQYKSTTNISTVFFVNQSLEQDKRLLNKMEIINKLKKYVISYAHQQSTAWSNIYPHEEEEDKIVDIISSNITCYEIKYPCLEKFIKQSSIIN